MVQEKAKKRLHVFVDGRVQGVGFRYFTVNTAQQLELTGWVKNLPDGRVEAVAEGGSEKLNAFATRLERGPGFSQVLSCNVSWTNATGEFNAFTVSF